MAMNEAARAGRGVATLGALVRFAAAERVAGGMEVAKALNEDLPENGLVLKMSRFSVAVGGATPLDSHSEAEVWMVAAGCGALSYRGEPPVMVQAGDVLRFQPRESHSVRNSGSVPLVVFSIWWGE